MDVVLGFFFQLPIFVALATELVFSQVCTFLGTGTVVLGTVPIYSIGLFDLHSLFLSLSLPN